MTLREWIQDWYALQASGACHNMSEAQRDDLAYWAGWLYGRLARMHAPCLDAPVTWEALLTPPHHALCPLAHSFFVVASPQLDAATFTALYQAAQRHLEESGDAPDTP